MTVPRPNEEDKALCSPPNTHPPAEPTEVTAPPTTSRLCFSTKSKASLH